MAARNTLKLVQLIPIALGCVLFADCQGNNSNSNNSVAIAPALTVCQAGSAEILVQDGFFQDMCGCAEGAGVVFDQPNPVTCTVPVNTTLLFLFEGAVRAHQIISTGYPQFVSSPLWDPPDNNALSSVFSFQFTASGTYTFFDSMDEAMTGQIVVTP